MTGSKVDRQQNGYLIFIFVTIAIVKKKGKSSVIKTVTIYDLVAPSTSVEVGIDS